MQHAPKENPRSLRFWWERLEVLMLSLMSRVLDLGLLLLHPRLFYTYLVIWIHEQIRNPYHWPRSFETVRLAKAANQELGEFVYGETPVFSAYYLFKKAGLSSKSVLVDLLAGRGRPLLAARALGAKTIGIELLPQHVEGIAEVYARVDIQLRQGDAARVELSDATHIYLAWTGMSPPKRAEVIEHLKETERTLIVITVDFPIDDGAFSLQSKHRPLFSWGPTDVFIHHLSPPSTQEETG
ncbi:class I SAM-dependent methyltransferase [Myxococcota bacterium]|nr:class I SAM-dependent methyltransferase [Myxococcota bacterium]